MFSTPGVILTVVLALLCSQITLTAWLFWIARRVARLSKLASLATKREQAPAQWESRLAELAVDVASLSSTSEKASRLLTRLNSRAGMRELRADRKADAPPPGASKAALRKYYGVDRMSGPAQAAHQLSLVQKDS